MMEDEEVISAAAYKAADEVIANLKDTAYDFSKGRKELARLFDKDLWNGHWISSTDFEESLGLPNLTFYQEDEFDQHLEDEDKPSDDDYIDYIEGHYVVLGIKEFAMDYAFLMTLHNTIKDVKEQGEGGFYVVVLPTDRYHKYDEGVISPTTDDNYELPPEYAFNPAIEQEWNLDAVTQIASAIRDKGEKQDA